MRQSRGNDGKLLKSVLASIRAVSQVISIVFLVSVSLIISVGVAYWMSGISSQYTRFAKIELKSAYCEYKPSYYDFNGTNADAWEIRLDVKNTGAAEVSLTGVYLNAKAIADYGNGVTSDWIVAYENKVVGPPIDFEEGGKVTLSPGSSKEIIILIAEDSGEAYSFSRAGVVIEISLYSGTGNVYMKMITLT